MIKLLATLLVIIVCSEAAKVTNLPGYVGPALNIYSGYIDVEPSHGRNMFYVHIESLNSPSTDPLVVWFQGGPGCSGLDGMMSENGPFRLNSKGGLDFFDVTWLHFANMIWIESPVGVGFSYSNTPSDYNTNDNQTAKDNYAFLQGFMKEFPQYAKRDLWLAGESYAGVYLPTLAQQITSHPGTALYNQFKGFTAGNPVFTCNQGGTEVGNNKETFNLLYWHGLVSYSNYKAWTSNNCDSNQNSAPCVTILNSAMKQVGKIDQQLKKRTENEIPKMKNQISRPTADNFPSLDPDCLYQDFCIGNGTLNYSLHKPADCFSYGDLIVTYFNREDVQVALHAKKTKWAVCSNSLNYTISGDNMVDYYDKVIAEKPSVKIMVYSGDVDILTVPFAYTMPCVDQITGTYKKTVVEWHPWFVNGATAGYTEQFSTYTYSTLKGAGHEAPMYQPLNAYEMEKRFIQTGKVDSDTDGPAYHEPELNQGEILRRLGLTVY